MFIIIQIIVILFSNFFRRLSDGGDVATPQKLQIWGSRGTFPISFLYFSGTFPMSCLYW